MQQATERDAAGTRLVWRARCILVDIGPFISSGQGFVYFLRRLLLHFMLDFISYALSASVAKVGPLSDLRLKRRGRAIQLKYRKLSKLLADGFVSMF